MRCTRMQPRSWLRVPLPILHNECGPAVPTGTGVVTNTRTTQRHRHKLYANRTAACFHCSRTRKPGCEKVLKLRLGKWNYSSVFVLRTPTRYLTISRLLPAGCSSPFHHQLDPARSVSWASLFSFPRAVFAVFLFLFHCYFSFLPVFSQLLFPLRYTPLTWHRPGAYNLDDWAKNWPGLFGPAKPDVSSILINELVCFVDYIFDKGFLPTEIMVCLSSSLMRTFAGVSHRKISHQ